MQSLQYRFRYFSKNILNTKNIIYSRNARLAMLLGVRRLERAVAVTLGPKGRNVLLDGDFECRMTKDGVTVAKEIEFQDRYQNLGAQMMREVAQRSNDRAGDGTTAAVILARELFEQGNERVSQGCSAIGVRRGVEKAVNHIIENLKRNSIQVSSLKDLTSVATISTNNDVELGALVAQACHKVGKEGAIIVEQGKTMRTEMEVVDGMKFNRGYISPYFATDLTKGVCELDNPLILVSDKRVFVSERLTRFMDHSLKTGRPLLIIAEDVLPDPLAHLIINKIRAGLKVCAVKAPLVGDNRKRLCEDISILTGAQLICDESGISWENAELDVIGGAQKVIITREETLIQNGHGDKKEIQTRIQNLQIQREKTQSAYDKEKLEERIGKLTSGVGVIKVGGYTETELKEVKDRITDAIHATKAAMEEGIVSGGGVALLNASQDLFQLRDNTKDADEQIGIRMVQEACRKPLIQICDNAGQDGKTILEQILKSGKQGYGYDAFNGRFVNMIEAGIIDPTKVIRTSLQGASSVASLLTSTEAMLVLQEEWIQDKDYKANLNYVM